MLLAHKIPSRLPLRAYQNSIAAEATASLSSPLRLEGVMPTDISSALRSHPGRLNRPATPLAVEGLSTASAPRGKTIFVASAHAPWSLLRALVSTGQAGRRSPTPGALFRGRRSPKPPFELTGIPATPISGLASKATFRSRPGRSRIQPISRPTRPTLQFSFRKPLLKRCGEYTELFSPQPPQGHSSGKAASKHSYRPRPEDTDRENP